MTYDEFDMVLEGHLEIEIDGRVVKGGVGDVIYIPKGSHIHFQTPGLRQVCLHGVSAELVGTDLKQKAPG